MPQKCWEGLLGLYFNVRQKILRKSHWALLYCVTKIIEKVSLSFTVPQKLLRKSHWALLYCATKNVEKSSLSFLTFLKQCKVAWKIILRRLFRGITMVDDFLPKYFLLKNVFSQTFKIGLFAKKWWRLKTFELFLHKIPSYMFDWVLNRPLLSDHYFYVKPKSNLETVIVY